MRTHLLLSQTFKGLKNNFIIATAVALVTFVSLLFVGAGWLLQLQIDHLKNDWYDKVEVSAFMCPTVSDSPQCAAGEATEAEINAVEDFLKTPQMQKYVQEYFIESKAEAFASFQKLMEGTAWADTITEDQMQVSFRIKLVDPEQYELVADELSGRPGIEVVNDQRAQLQPLFAVLNKVTIISIGLAAIMIVAAVFLISTTIRLSALIRSKEIGIMRLVGASNWFVRTPFILEGVIAALVGAALAIGGLALAVRYIVGDWIGSAVQWVKLVSLSDVAFISPFLIAGTVIIAVLASHVTISKYTKV